ncbi:MAG TPA: hypothetical protein VIN11_02075 [Roseivirga sp.]
MGFLPLFVALFGLILLYSIFTYNQIKPRKAQLNRVIDQMAENSRNRKQLVLQYEAQNPESELKELAEKLKKTSTDRFQSYKKEEEFIADFDRIILALKNAELSTQLKAMNHKQEELMKSLKAKANEYNRFIQKSPASVVASVFGFRQF